MIFIEEGKGPKKGIVSVNYKKRHSAFKEGGNIRNMPQLHDALVSQHHTGVVVGVLVYASFGNLFLQRPDTPENSRKIPH